MDYSSIMEIERLTTKAKSFGLKIQRAKFSSGDYNPIALVPLDDHWPSYSRDAELYTGTVSELIAFMDGLDRMRTYYRTIDLIDDDKLAAAEQRVRNQIVFDKLRS